MIRLGCPALRFEEVMIKTKSKRTRPTARLWAIRAPRAVPGAPMPDEVNVLIDGEPNAVSLRLYGWTTIPSFSAVSYERITRNLTALQQDWSTLFGEGWALEVREQPRQPLPIVPTPPTTSRTMRIRVEGNLRFEREQDVRLAIQAALTDDPDELCAFTAEELEKGQGLGARLRVVVDERLPRICWDATVRVLTTLSNLSEEGYLHAQLENEAVVEFRRDPSLSVQFRSLQTPEQCPRMVPEKATRPVPQVSGSETGRAGRIPTRAGQRLLDRIEAERERRAQALARLLPASALRELGPTGTLDDIEE